MRSIRDAGFIRLSHLVGTKETPGPVPLSKATIWRRVKLGTFPRPVKIGEHTTAWRVEDIRAWIEAQGQGDAA